MTILIKLRQMLITSTIPGTYIDAKKRKTLLEEYERKASEVLKKFPKGTIGLTPDAVKESDVFQKAQRDYKIAFKNLQDYNTLFVKQYRKEYMEDRRRR